VWLPVHVPRVRSDVAAREASRSRSRETEKPRERDKARAEGGRERENFAALGVFVAEGKGRMDGSGFFYLGAPGGSLPSSPARWLFSPPSGARGPSR
jgi:hypothetical protein